MIFSKYPKYKQGGCWLGYHYIDHRSNHVHNAMLRKKFRSKKERKYERITWNLNNRILDVYLPLRMAFVDREYYKYSYKVDVLMNFAHKLISEQKPLPKDDRKLLEENFWSLV